MDFKSLPELLEKLSDKTTDEYVDKAGTDYYEQIRWNGKPVCPHCNSNKTPYRSDRKRLVTKNGMERMIVTKGYLCSDSTCRKKFSVKVGTIFQDAKVSFRIFFAAMYLCNNHKKGISSLQLAADLGITQKTAWTIWHKIREIVLNNEIGVLGESKVVEADEAYIGGKEINKHYGKKRNDDYPALTNDGSPYKPKKPILGIIERDGNVVLKHLNNLNKSEVVDTLKLNVSDGSVLNTDESTFYYGLSNIYDHKTIVHSQNMYVKGSTHTNTIENFWSLFKRGLYGIYHQVSEKHLHRYLDEFASRYNNRKLTPQQKMVKYLEQSEKILTYDKLTAA